MFNSIKTKILFITASIFLILAVLLSFLAFVDYEKDKTLYLKFYDYYISTIAGRAKQRILKLESGAVDFALLGEAYYKSDKDRAYADYLVKTMFEKQDEVLGGGWFFEPYAIDKNKKFHSIYAFRKGENVVLDKGYESEKYNYLNQVWYTDIKPQLEAGKLFAWSRPYYDMAGSHSLMITVGAGIYDGDELIGIATIDWGIETILQKAKEIKPTKNSFVLSADREHDYVFATSDPKLDNTELVGKSLDDIPWYDAKNKNKQKVKYNNVDYIQYVKDIEAGSVIVVNVPEKELLASCLLSLYVLIIVLVVSCVFISGFLYWILNRNINVPIKKLMKMAHEIGAGNFEVEIKLDKPTELAKLAATFNQMAKNIKTHLINLNKVTQEKEKIESELSIARTIQYAVLPHDFNINNRYLNICASMETAKEVGGDFYDFFFIDKTRFMFLVADVSGKGIPAALFMMTTKSLIKTLAKENYTPKELIEKINDQICENNEQGFFVTMFAGIIDISTGAINYINCGHNPPIIKKADGEYEYLKINSNLVLGAVDDVKYEIVNSKLEKNDILLLYTDGVTEAMNCEDELYGEERLLTCLKNMNSGSIKDIIDGVKRDVNAYIDGKEQSDDITMIGVKYLGDYENVDDTERFKSVALVEKYRDYQAWLQKLYEKYSIPCPLISKIELVSEEIFTNVVKYAYPDKQGNIEVEFQKNNENIILKFIDDGFKYNPLENTDPDITLSAEERKIGGLGILMVKKLSKSVEYFYNENNQNVLTITL